MTCTRLFIDTVTLAALTLQFGLMYLAVLYFTDKYFGYSDNKKLLIVRVLQGHAFH